MNVNEEDILSPDERQRYIDELETGLAVVMEHGPLQWPALAAAEYVDSQIRIAKAVFDKLHGLIHGDPGDEDGDDA